MKKLLSILAAVGLTATASTSVVACTSATNAKHAVSFKVQADSTSAWGAHAKSLVQLVKYNDSLAKKDQDKNINKMWKEIKKVFGFKKTSDDNFKAGYLVDYIFKEGFTPNNLPSKKMKATAINDYLKDNYIDDTAMQTKAKADGETFYFVLAKATTDSNEKVPVMLFKVTFTKVATK